MIHRIQLTNGEWLRIEERDRSLHVASELHGDTEYYVCTISPDGVLVMPNSGEACYALTHELIEGDVL